MHGIVTRTRTAVVAALAVATTFGLAGTAAADDISNNLDAVVDATAEQMPLNVGGTQGTTTLFVQPRNGDGDNGCNFEPGGGSLTIALASSDTSVATVSPSSATFTGCGSTALVTVTPVGAGTVTIAATQSSNTTAGSFSLAPVTFTVVVAAPSNSAPTVEVVGVTPGASYPEGSVPTAMCEVTDAEDGDSTFPATISGDLDAGGLGSQTATCSYTDAGGLEAESSATYSIIDGTAPVITYTLDPATPDGLLGWYTSDVVLDWTVTETDSPATLVTEGCDDVSIAADQLETTYTCSASSSGGIAESVTVTVKRDANGPTVSYLSADGTTGENGWYVSPVTATFTASDLFSGVDTTSGTTTSTGDGTSVVLDSPAFTDLAGNESGAGAATSPAFKIDTIAPSVGDAVLAGTEGDNEWYTTDVTASFTATDDTSGVASTNPGVVSSGGVQGVVTLTSPEFKDVAGNTTPAGAKSATVKVDTVAPSVSLVGGPASGSSHYFGSVPAAPTCSASDATSGLDGTCAVSGYGTGVGDHTVTATVTDLAGNTSTVSRTYHVLAWTGKGFYSPVDMNGVWNKVKGGSTVPLKFELFAGPTELTSTASIKSFEVHNVQCESGATVDEIEMLTSGSTSLRYDATGGQFIQNWKVPAAVGCYRATMTALDGTTIAALFKVTK